MNRKQFLLGAAGTFAGLALEASPEGNSRRPNIILVLADDVSAKDFSLYGGTGVETPTLDRMGREGCFFETAWTVPVCGPSRCLLRTGRYAHRTQYYGNTIAPRMPTHVNHVEIPELLRTAGYRTLMVGKNHDGYDPTERGYDAWCLVGKWPGYTGTHQSPEWAGPQARERGMYAVQWYFHPALYTREGGIPTTPEDFGPDLEADYICDFIQDERDRPFYIYWPTNLPHMMHSAARKWHYTDVPARNAAGERTGERVPGGLSADLAYLDFLLGRILDTLEASGLARDTIVLFAGDNGTAGYGKQRLESEVGPRVPLVVYGPGRVDAAGPKPDLVDFSDLLPTLAELAGASLPEGYAVDGVSFAPALRGDGSGGREWIFCQLEEARWLRDRRWLLDGNGHFWDCGTNRDETRGYRDVTRSEDAEVMAARRRFEDILAGIPPIDYEHPLTRERWQQYRASHPPHTPYRPPYVNGGAG